jgi:small subunit ribosomal protein S16
VGATKRPSYRVVAIDSRRARDGRALEILGFYDPLTEPATVQIDAARLKVWLGNGALPSDTVAKLMQQAGVAPDGTQGARPEPRVAPKPKRASKPATAKRAAASASKAAAAAAADVSDEVPGHVPAEPPDEVPGEVSAEAPEEVPDEVPAEAPMEAPGDVPAEIPVEAPGEVTDQGQPRAELAAEPDAEAAAPDAEAAK